MKRLAKTVLALLFILLVVEILLLAPVDIEQQSSPLDTDFAEPASGKAEQTMRGLHLVEARSEQKEWELWADQAMGMKATDEWNLEQVRAMFFANDGSVFRVTGQRGQVQVRSKDMRVEGKVVTRSSNGYVFRAGSAVYESSNRKLISPGPIEMTGPADGDGHRLRLKGTTMVTNLNDSLMKVENDVVGEKKFDDKLMVIQSEQAEFSGVSNYARFLGKVTMDLGTMRMTGDEATFSYDSTNNIVKSMQVLGGVRVSDLDKWAVADGVTVHFEEDKFVLEGNPRVVQNNDEIRGEKIIFSDGGKRVEVIKARAKVDKQKMEKLN